MIYPPHHFEERFGARFPIDPEMPRWDAYKAEMKGSQLRKARNLNKLKLVEQIDEFNFLVHPRIGYNKTTYNVGIDGESCNCQCNKNGKGKRCAHLMAVYLFIMNKGGIANSYNY
jgi:hypothetical protein